MHLAKEDNYLYPKLASSNDQSLVQTARNFQDEMGGLSGGFEKFKNEWTRKRFKMIPKISVVS
ncbi:MAG: hemerythrin domain-containing protein [Bdellovibrionota bacterium]